MRFFVGLISALVIAWAGLAGAKDRMSSRGVAKVNPAFSDADPTNWTGPKPHQYPIHGIDVSRWQTQIDWRRARASGISFAFIKATEGVEDLDPMFKKHWE